MSALHEKLQEFRERLGRLMLQSPRSAGCNDAQIAKGATMLVKDAARRAADDVRKTYWDGSFPVNPVTIAERMNATVKFAQFQNPDLSGAIVAEDEAITILIAETEPIERQTFTCAHEIGHLMERRQAGDKEYSFVEARSSRSYDLHEFYADEFAGNLLMPEKKFADLYRAGAGISGLADYFMVSRTAVGHRLERLRRYGVV